VIKSLASRNLLRYSTCMPVYLPCHVLGDPGDAPNANLPSFLLVSLAIDGKTHIRTVIAAICSIIIVARIYYFYDFLLVLILEQYFKLLRSRLNL